MNPQRILPDLQSALLCEDVRQEASGNFILLGITALIRVPQIPITAMKLCAFTRWTCGLGQFTECTRLLAPDQTTVLRESKVKFLLQDPVHNASNLSVFTNVELKEAGVYHLEVLVDDVMKIRVPVPVAVAPVQQPDRPAAAAGEADSTPPEPAAD